jgi:hypothetical protein
MSDPEWVTYAEAAKRLGISVEGVRLKVKRDQKRGRDAKLRIRRDNAGRVLLAWDQHLLDQRWTQRGIQQNDGDVGAAGAVEALTKLVAQMQADHAAALTQARQDAQEARQEAREARERAEGMVRSPDQAGTHPGRRTGRGGGAGPAAGRAGSGTAAVVAPAGRAVIFRQSLRGW